MEQFFILAPSFSSMAWSHAWCLGRQCEASSLNTLEYLWYCTGICDVDGFGAVCAAISVLVVVLALMARSSYLVKLWLYRNASMASWANSFTTWSGVSSLVTMALIVIEHVCGLLDCMTRGTLDKVHIGGQQVNAICGRAQSTSGLCIQSQSVPNMMSWSPSMVT